MSYLRPQNRIFQTSTVQPSINTSPRRACVLAPVAKLIRFAVESEQALGRLGFYDNVVETPFDWPDKPSASKVDLAYTKIFMKNALLRYFSDSASGGADIWRDISKPNLIQSELTFATNDADDRDSLFYDRDVKVGDVVKARGLVDGDPVTLWTTVKAIHGLVVAAVVSSASGLDENATTDGGSANATKVSGPRNCVFLTGSAASYNGFIDGYVIDTYTFEVIGSSTGGDFTTATIRVTSASGLDDVDEFVPAATTVAKACGTRGLTVTFTFTDGSPCGDDADEDGVSHGDLIIGQIWTMEVHGPITAPVATSGGTYSGNKDASYIIEVTRGGKYADSPKPQITVSSSIGHDQSGPTLVTAAATPVLVGSYGVTVQFSGSGLRKGDKYIIPVTAEGVGALKYLELAHNFDPDMADEEELDLDLYIKVPTLEISKNRLWDPPEVSWAVSQTEITMEPGLTATDPTWTDSGTLLRMPVYSEESKNYGVLYAEARYWRSDISGSIGAITDVGDLPTLIGGDDSNDNPLYRGLRYALENGGGQTILYGAVSDPDDIDSWATMLGKLIHRTDVGAIAACTNTQAVHDLVIAHAVAMGSPENKKFRRVFTPSYAVPVTPIVHAGSDVVGHTLPTTGDGELALFTMTDDPDTSGTQYTRVVCTSDNANLVSNGVRAGDILRINFGTDGFDGLTYEEYVIASVLSEDEMRLEDGPATPISIGVKGEVWRRTSAGEEADEFILQCGANSSELITKIVPDSFEAGAESVPSYFAACAHMALAYGVLPNQGLTHVEILGFSSVQRITNRFNDVDLDRIAAAGGCIITQDPQTGRIYIRHAVTTGDTNNISVREEMMVRNKFDILYSFADAYEPFLGRTNTTDRLIARIEVITNDIIRQKLDVITNPDLGPQLQSLDAPIVVERNDINRDRIDVFVKCTGVAPNNGVDLHIAF